MILRTMDPVDNNKFEVLPTKSKRKIATPCTNAYFNPALDLLANDDPMCNTAMEIVPIKKRKRTRSCDITAFENSALDLGISKAAVNEFLAKELENVRKNVRPYNSVDVIQNSEPRMNISEPTLNFSTLDSIDNGIPVMREPFYANLCTAPELPLKNVCAVTPISNVSITNIDKMLNMEANSNITPELLPKTVPMQTNLNNTCQNMSTAEGDEITIPDAQITIHNVAPDVHTVRAKESNMDDSAARNCMEISENYPPNDIELDSGISVLEQKSFNPTNSEFSNSLDLSAINNTTSIQTNITNQVFVNTPSNLSLSFIDRLALDSPNISKSSLCLDDDLNESNIMEIKTITIITKKKRIVDKKKNTNPFLDPNIDGNSNQPKAIENPFRNPEITEPELQYNDEALSRPAQVQIPQINNMMPRRLFIGDTNSTISTVDDSMNIEQHEYENIDGYRSESPIYENVGEEEPNHFNKQSKILGHDVSHFSAVDIMNLNKNCQSHCVNSSNESNESKKDLKHQILKASKLSKKVFKKLKKTFKGEKSDNNVTLNPYEIPRKLPKQKVKKNESGIENPALNLDNSDEIEIFEEIDDDDEEHQYETIKTLRNTRLNMNVTPLKERSIDNVDVSHNKTNTPGKKVRFDSTLNQEKVITGNSFDYDVQSPGFDAKIDKYHDELENCINEQKYLQQNM
ncbi:uncharacterized protein LOC113240674 [Hyposmocoma kahamanoa]|uniref:uncharacterized protein LOC113240674 n=1 Tax=Hyposmocoma kahamanoa TaxID=1477025 RepID=UPI000E6D9BA9|nr:uncharacterized protein LOC113240674 [Hyposmocoma kahamanoa]